MTPLRNVNKNLYHLGVSNGVSPIFLVFLASTRVSMGRADVPSAGLSWREKRQPSTSTGPFDGFDRAVSIYSVFDEWILDLTSSLARAK